MGEYKGCIVEESLEDNRVLNNLKTVKVRITDDENPIERWHIYDSLVSEEQIEKLHKFLKQGWYMHFWNENEMIVLFRDKRFVIDPNRKETWKEAVEYGLSINIPEEQLDFEMEF